ncbi:MAG: rhomboid family intramembrane serine protease, partial [Methanocellales archaeon]|nr:rhomboid family intramembrane serine protease [Methanocellales archaeon]
ADPNSIAVGASGAIFALGGTLSVLRPNLKVFIIPFPIPIPLWIAVIGGFLVLSLMPSISWQAHLGGLIAGLVFGYYFKNKKNGVGREDVYRFYDYRYRY